MNPPLRICLIEDDASARLSLERVLRREGLEIGSHPDGVSGLRAALAEDFDCVLTDFRMPGMSGLDLVEALRRKLPDLPVVLMTAHGTTDVAIEATRRGAFEYILKPFEMDEMIAVVVRAATAARRAREKVVFGAEQSPETALIGQSRAMQAVYKEIGRVAGKPVTVLLLGETGTGKELVARALWQYGDRSDRPFVAVNCAAIPSGLLESELFGHEKGSFTGADARRVGRFEQAKGGTLLLDEVADLPLDTQAKLLRVLQERVLSRVGGTEALPVDVRVIASTHRDLGGLVAAGKFRQDLWYRLNVVAIALPPLRERREDIPDLVNYFVARYGPELGGAVPVQPSAMKHLAAQPWPGNVRELENAVKRALLLARGFAITEELARTALVPVPLAAVGAENGQHTIAELCERSLTAARRTPGFGAAATAFAALEAELLRRALAATSGNLTQMAQLLGWSRLTTREKLKLHGLRQDCAGPDGCPARR